MDIPDYLTDPNPDKQEWIKRHILTKKWELRRVVEELEYVAEQYQMKKKYQGSKKDLDGLKSELRALLQRAYDLAIEIRDLT